MKYTKKQLEEWGFERTDVPPKDNDGINPYFYYTLDFDKDVGYNCSLISDAFDKGVKKVGIQFFEGKKNLSKEFIEALIKEFKK